MEENIDQFIRSQNNAKKDSIVIGARVLRYSYPKTHFYCALWIWHFNIDADEMREFLIVLN